MSDTFHLFPTHSSSDGIETPPPIRLDLIIIHHHRFSFPLLVPVRREILYTPFRATPHADWILKVKGELGKVYLQRFQDHHSGVRPGIDR